MNEINYDEMTRDLDDVKPEQPMEGGALPGGWYILRVADVQGQVTKNGVPQARMRVAVVEGDQKGRNAFVSINLGASPLDPDGRQRSPEERTKTANKVKGQLKQLRVALGGVDIGVPTGEGPELVYTAYNIADWKDREFVGRLTFKAAGKNETTGREYNESNGLAEFYAVDDPKKGAEFVRARSANAAHNVASAGSI